MEEKNISVQIGVIYLFQQCWMLANGDVAQAKAYYAWVQEADTQREKALRTVAVQKCPCGNPIEFYQWISSYAKTVIY